MLQWRQATALDATAHSSGSAGAPQSLSVGGTVSGPDRAWLGVVKVCLFLRERRLAQTLSVAARLNTLDPHVIAQSASSSACPRAHRRRGLHAGPLLSTVCAASLAWSCGLAAASLAQRQSQSMSHQAQARGAQRWVGRRLRCSGEAGRRKPRFVHTSGTQGDDGLSSYARLSLYPYQGCRGILM